LTQGAKELAELAANWLVLLQRRAYFSFPDLDRPTELWNMA
jgi:hypothetical protein